MAVVVTAVSIGIAHASAPLAALGGSRSGLDGLLLSEPASRYRAINPHDLGPRPGAFSFRKFATELPTAFTNS